MPLPTCSLEWQLNFEDPVDFDLNNNDAQERAHAMTSLMINESWIITDQK